MATSCFSMFRDLEIHGDVMLFHVPGPGAPWRRHAFPCSGSTRIEVRSWFESFGEHSERVDHPCGVLPGARCVGVGGPLAGEPGSF
jgi:hypothetical protein